MRRRSTAEVRRLVLDAAAGVFEKKGFARATVDEIAETAGVAMSVLFRHFPSKGDLFRDALMAPFVESMRIYTAAWRKTFSEPVDERHIMRELVGDLYDGLRAHEYAVSGLIAAQESLDPSTTKELERIFNEIFAQLREMGELEAERRGWFSGEDMELTARLLLGMVTSTVAYRRWYLPAGRNRISRERLVNHMADLLLYGLRLGPSDLAQRATTASDDASRATVAT